MDSKTKWDTFYASTTREPFLHLTETQVAEILAGSPSAHSALDIGCGEGQLLEQLEQSGLTVTGIDVSPVALSAAKERVEGTLIEGDFESFNFNTNSTFDLIFLKFVIAFIDDKERLFQKIHSLLNEGGELVLLTPVISGVKELKSIEEIFVEKHILDECLPKYFGQIKEDILYKEGGKKLSLFVCKK